MSSSTTVKKQDINLLSLIGCEQTLLPSSIQLALSDHVEKASWSWETNQILVHPSLTIDPVNFLAFVIFELFNATKTAEFKKIVTEGQSQANCDLYVKKFEQLEHISAMQTIALMAKITEQEFELRHLFTDFDTHYACQQIQGHSQKIHQKYFPQATYLGSLTLPLSEVDELTRKALYAIGFYVRQLQKGNTKYQQSMDDFMNRLQKNTPLPHCLRALNIARALFPTFVSM